MKRLFFSIIALSALVCGSMFAQTTEKGVVINGVTWATRNVDAPGKFAKKPESEGMMYQWGLKTAFSSTRTTYNNTNANFKDWSKQPAFGSTWTKENDPSPEGWRVPTEKELRSLLDTKKVRSKNTTLNGVEGVMYIDRTTNDSIFLPSVGYRETNGWLTTTYNTFGNRMGSYWSATSASEGTTAYFLLNRYDSEVIAMAKVCARSIRPVQRKDEDLNEISAQDTPKPIPTTTSKAKPKWGANAEGKPFEGNVRYAITSNFDKAMKDASDKKVESGSNFLDMIANRMIKNRSHGLQQDYAAVTGEFELIMKTKGNKIAHVRMSDGFMTLTDCDEGKIYSVWPHAKAALRYNSIDEYRSVHNRVYETYTYKDSIREVAGYQCKRGLVIAKEWGRVTMHAEMWYTNDISLPQCFLDGFQNLGLSLYENQTLGNNPMFLFVTEIEETEISDDAFIIPADYVIFNAKDPKERSEFSKRVNKAAKNKKTYTVGSKIPDTFWDE